MNSRYSGSDYSGHEVGALAAGGTGEHLFTMTLDESWVVKNCHDILRNGAFVDKGYAVTNAIDVPVKLSTIPLSTDSVSLNVAAYCCSVLRALHRSRPV